jgi:hypothetical protein
MKSLLVKTKNMALLHIQYITENEFQYMKMPPHCCTVAGAFDRRSSAGALTTRGHMKSPHCRVPSKPMDAGRLPGKAGVLMGFYWK